MRHRKGRGRNAYDAAFTRRRRGGVCSGVAPPADAESALLLAPPASPAPGPPADDEAGEEGALVEVVGDVGASMIAYAVTSQLLVLAVAGD